MNQKLYYLLNGYYITLHININLVFEETLQVDNITSGRLPASSCIPKSYTVFLMDTLLHSVTCKYKVFSGK